MHVYASMVASMPLKGKDQHAHAGAHALTERSPFKALEAFEAAHMIGRFYACHAMRASVEKCLSTCLKGPFLLSYLLQCIHKGVHAYCIVRVCEVRQDILRQAHEQVVTALAQRDNHLACLHAHSTPSNSGAWYDSYTPTVHMGIVYT